MVNPSVDQVFLDPRESVGGGLGADETVDTIDFRIAGKLRGYVCAEGPGDTGDDLHGFIIRKPRSLVKREEKGATTYKGVGFPRLTAKPRAVLDDELPHLCLDRDVVVFL